MTQETDLIPYRSSHLPSGPWLVFAPHPDDEVIGMGGTIALGVKQSIAIEVVVVTDGQEAGQSRERRSEALDAGDVIGVSKYHFWDLPDRQLQFSAIPGKHLESIITRLSPQTIFLPGIQEFHPDHRACTFQVLKFLEDSTFHGKVWLYEISRQNEANRLVDITGVIEQKKQAIQCFESQLAQNDYLNIAMSLNKARSYTLPANIGFAEGFWEGDSRGKYQAAYGQLKRLNHFYMKGRKINNFLVSVVVRTKNRLDLLEEALESIAFQTYRPIEAIIVNDGGVPVPVGKLKSLFSDIIIKYKDHKISQGRSEAANTGIKEASGEFILFLDDDDLFYPECVKTLVDNASQNCFSHAKGKCVRYNAEKSAVDEDYVIIGRPVKLGRLVLENCIPFNTACFHRSMLEQVGPLDKELEIFEDWDLMIRVAGKFRSIFVDRLVSEYRVFDNATITGKGGDEKHLMYRKLILSKYLDLIEAGDILAFNQSSIDKVVLEKEKLIFKLREKLNLLSNDLGEGVSSKEVLESEYLKAKAYVGDLLVEMERLRSEADGLRSQVEKRDNNIAILEDCNKALQSSISWKITKPLRIFKALLFK
ncbi:glycosyltransferase [Desulfonatronovibrio magnus]|uniref:glycosyltransferase n=1 Tax=Desulfonatronovibrio magnus TaxID=698827 RepID=UPI0005EB823F|nr:glycosyltransferase [Desulfonatronovibrio magnus]